MCLQILWGEFCGFGVEPNKSPRANQYFTKFGLDPSNSGMAIQTAQLEIILWHYMLVEPRRCLFRSQAPVEPWQIHG